MTKSLASSKSNIPLPSLSYIPQIPSMTAYNYSSLSYISFSLPTSYRTNPYYPLLVTWYYYLILKSYSENNGDSSTNLDFE